LRSSNAGLGTLANSSTVVLHTGCTVVDAVKVNDVIILETTGGIEALEVWRFVL
jgi:hypothetical protein